MYASNNHRAIQTLLKNTQSHLSGEINQLFHTTVEPIEDRLSGILNILREVVEDVGMQYTIVHNSMITLWLQYLTGNHIDDLTARSVDLFGKTQELSMFLLDIWEGIRLVKPFYRPF